MTARRALPVGIEPEQRVIVRVADGRRDEPAEVRAVVGDDVLVEFPERPRVRIWPRGASGNGQRPRYAPDWAWVKKDDVWPI